MRRRRHHRNHSTCGIWQNDVVAQHINIHRLIRAHRDASVVVGRYTVSLQRCKGDVIDTKIIAQTRRPCTIIIDSNSGLCVRTTIPSLGRKLLPIAATYKLGHKIRSDLRSIDFDTEFSEIKRVGHITNVRGPKSKTVIGIRLDSHRLRPNTIITQKAFTVGNKKFARS